MTNVEKFFETLKTDKELQQKLKVAWENYSGDKNTLKGTGDREAAVKAILLPASEAAGCAFTADELREYENSLAAKADGAELSADEMKSVAGGLTCIFTGFEDSSGACIVYGGNPNTHNCVLIGID